MRWPGERARRPLVRSAGALVVAAAVTGTALGAVAGPVPAQATTAHDDGIATTCPGPGCPYTPPTADEQGAAADILARINLERAAPARDYAYQGTETALAPLAAATGAEETAQAAAEWQASHDMLADYEGPRPAGYTYGTPGNAAVSGSSAGIDDVIMHSYGHALAMLSAAPTEVAIGAACAAGGSLYVTELFYDTGPTSWHAGQARLQVELSENNVEAQSGGTITTVTDTTGTGPADNVLPQQPIVAGDNAEYATGVDWSCYGPSYPTGPSPTSTLPAPVVGMAATPTGGGYWLADAQGGVAADGNAQLYGSMAGQPLDQPVTHIVAAPTGGGYWLVAADGGIFSFGRARFFGSMGGQHLNAPVVDVAPTPTGGGYWLVAGDGGVFAFGNARFLGSMGGKPLNQPVVGLAPTSTGGGYWLVASDGGVFSFGDAPFYGSTGSLRLDAPVVGLAATPTGRGYWMVAADGGIFAFGDAAFEGSMGGQPLDAPVAGMAADPATGGYWLVAGDGGIFSFDAPFYGAD